MAGISNTELKKLIEQNFGHLAKKIEGYRKESVTEIKGLREDHHELCGRMITLEERQLGHTTNEHKHITETLSTLAEGQKSNTARLFDQGVRLAELAALVAAVAKLAGLW